MENLEYKNLLDAGVHFGHLTRKWNPKMAPYIFMERNGIHIIDLNKSLACLDEASRAIKQIVRSGRKVMFVATKKQAKEIVAEQAQALNMPYVTERWLCGMLTNFATIRKSLKKILLKLLKYCPPIPKYGPGHHAEPSTGSGPAYNFSPFVETTQKLSQKYT